MPADFLPAWPLGVNSFTFTGKIGGHKLAPGAYQLTATPTGGTGHTATFTLKP